MIDFPYWVKTSSCERQTGTVLDETPHGWVRRERSGLTDHGRTMAVWRARFERPDTARAERRITRTATRYRRVPADITPGRYSW